MGVGITNTVVLTAEKELMKPAIGNALKLFYNKIKDDPISGDQYADKFAEVLVDTMFDRIINYVSTNANVTGNFATVPPSGPGAPPTCGPTLLNGAVL